MLNQDTLIAAQKQDPPLNHLREKACTDEESENLAEGVYLKDDVLLRKWGPPTRPAAFERSVHDQVSGLSLACAAIGQFLGEDSEETAAEALRPLDSQLIHVTIGAV